MIGARRNKLVCMVNLGFNSIKSAAELRAVVDELEEEVSKGNGRAAFELALVHNPDNTVMSEELKPELPCSYDSATLLYEKAFTLLLKEAEDGNSESMHLVGMYYQTGWPPVSQDSEKAIEWNERAFAAGNTFAANDLYSFYSEGGQFYNPEKAKFYLDILERADCRVVEKRRLD